MFMAALTNFRPGRDNREGVGFVSSATLLVLTQSLVCCIHQLNPQALAVIQISGPNVNHRPIPDSDRVCSIDRVRPTMVGQA